MLRPPVITLTTDFGIKDGNVGVMKGVILGIAPDAKIADISHMISPQNVLEAALILLRSVPYFPDGTIHVYVVDPGVGTARRPIAVRLGAHYFVGPDNGALTMLLERAEAQNLSGEFFHLDQPQYWRTEVSHVFHGRDIFAPVAGHLAAGIPLSQLGAPINDPVRLALPHPQRTPDGWRGEVIHIDTFGNLSTNIRIEHMSHLYNSSTAKASIEASLTIRLCGVEIYGMVHTFGERPPGELAALYGSTGNLIVSVVNGSAAERLSAKIGDPVEATLLPVHLAT